MSIQYYPNGIGGYPPGDFLDTCKPLQTSGNVWYVSSLIGIDAVAPAGQNREKPLATMLQAVTNAVDGDIIVFLPGHTQTLTLTQTLLKRLTLMGEGVVDGKPAVTLRANMPALNLLQIGAPNCEIRNIYFAPNLALNSDPKVNVGDVDFLIRGCYFDCGGNDKGPNVALQSSRARIESSTFISVATASNSQPKAAITTFTGSNITGFTMRDTVISAGPFGFANYAAVDLTVGTAISQVVMENISLLLGADMVLLPATTGRINIQTATGGSRVQW